MTILSISRPKTLATTVTACLATLALFQTGNALAQQEILHQSVVHWGDESYTLQKIVEGDMTYPRFLDNRGNQITAENYQAIVEKHSNPFGAIHPDLYRMMQENPAARFQVVVQLNIEEQQVLDKPDDLNKTNKALVVAELEQQAIAFSRKLDFQKIQILQKLDVDKLWNDSEFFGTPFARLSLSADQILKLANNNQVNGLYVYDSKGIDDIANALKIANADDLQSAGIKGNGEKVGVFECRPNLLSNASWSLNVDEVNSGSSNPCSSSHSRHVHGIISNTGSGGGFAPKAKLYSSNGKALSQFDWLVDDKRVSALNQSFHRGAEINDGMSFDDIYKDYKVLHYPWPTIVHAAGNWCPAGSSCYELPTINDEFVNHKGYNTISVGNHNDNASAMSSSSIFKNPTTAHNDRELPEISANGTSVTTVGLTFSGTSMSSPAVTGSVALLQNAVTTLRHWPEGIRALLFAGAHTNIKSHPGIPGSSATHSWWDDVSAGNDGFDGSGALDVYQSQQISKNRWNGVPLSRGWDIGSIHDSKVKNGYFTEEYEVKVPWSLLQKVPVKVALAWNSTATLNGGTYSSSLDIDLDIHIYNASGHLVAYSVSWDNSYEIAEFMANRNQTYTVKIRRFSGAGDFSWFGIAWNSRPFIFTFPVFSNQLTIQR
ncbi:MAG TPA: hypothetical protein ENJ32_10810 [Crenotrichaceae bacterium]|nr:hypothetical protein [Crenotrichaceae bacterium]